MIGRSALRAALARIEADAATIAALREECDLLRKARDMGRAVPSDTVLNEVERIHPLLERWFPGKKSLLRLESFPISPDPVESFKMRWMLNVFTGPMPLEEAQDRMESLEAEAWPDDDATRLIWPVIVLREFNEEDSR